MPSTLRNLKLNTTGLTSGLEHWKQTLRRQQNVTKNITKWKNIGVMVYWFKKSKWCRARVRNKNLWLKYIVESGVYIFENKNSNNVHLNSKTLLWKLHFGPPTLETLSANLTLDASPCKGHFQNVTLETSI